MRPISQWHQQMVAYVGVVSHWETLPNGQYRILMLNVKVRPYPSDIEAVLVNHLWFYTDYLPKQTQRLLEFVGLGHVFRYTRSDGSIDYAIRWAEWVALEDEIDNLVARHTFQRAPVSHLLAYLDTLIDAHQANKAFVRFETSLAEYADCLTLMLRVRDDFVVRLNGIRASQELAKQQFRGTVKPDPVRFPVNPRSRSRVGGFSPCR